MAKKKTEKRPVGRLPAPEPHVDAPTKSVVDFVLRTRKPEPKNGASDAEKDGVERGG